VDAPAAALVDIVGPAHVLADPDVVRSFTVDWTGRWHGPASLVVRPGTTGEVAAVVQACLAAGVAIVPQGGNTGLVGGSVPASSSPGPAPVVLSLVRLQRLDPVEAEAAQVTVGAGVTLAALARHVAGSGAGLAFPVDLGARDSATVGGMVATNAGGIHFIRYGGMRQQVVGVEAVLPDGGVVSRLNGLAKDNTGYDLAGLFTGSEGTLGVVTAARLRLVPDLAVRVAAVIGVAGTGAAVALVGAMRAELDNVEAAEIYYHQGLELVQRGADIANPLGRPWPAYLLVECAGPDEAVLDRLARFMADHGVADDATAVATESAGRRQLWAVRERHAEAVGRLGVPHKLDVSLPVGELAAFVAAVHDAVAAVAPGAAVVIWGHVGDGNLHVNVVGPARDDDAVDDAVFRLAVEMGGGISAEHGIGRAKLGWIHLTRSEADIGAMRTIKRALDPRDLLNPGVLLPPPSARGQ
jgi:FAD/FMN-containing dehydrogenase